MFFTVAVVVVVVVIAVAKFSHAFLFAIFNGIITTEENTAIDF